MTACAILGMGPEPGHMVIGQVSDDGTSQFFGYRFDPTDLPTEFQSKEQWQAYLLHNKTPGSIYEEKKYIQEMIDSGAVYFEKRAKCNSRIQAAIPPQENWRHYADYSFSPDDFHSDDHPW